MRRLMRNQWLKPAELKALQDKKLRALIKHSYRNVPYYHSLFEKAEIRPEDIQTVEDLKKIPITLKEDIRDLPLEEITAKNADLNKCQVHKTSGSTGIPFTVYYSWQLQMISYLLNFRNHLTNGAKITSRIVDLGTGWIPIDHLIQKFGIFKMISVKFLK